MHVHVYATSPCLAIIVSACILGNCGGNMPTSIPNIDAETIDDTCILQTAVKVDKKAHQNGDITKVIKGAEGGGNDTQHHSASTLSQPSSALSQSMVDLRLANGNLSSITTTGNFTSKTTGGVRNQYLIGTVIVSSSMLIIIVLLISWSHFMSLSRFDNDTPEAKFWEQGLSNPEFATAFGQLSINNEGGVHKVWKLQLSDQWKRRWLRRASFIFSMGAGAVNILMILSQGCCLLVAFFTSMVNDDSAALDKASVSIYGTSFYPSHAVLLASVELIGVLALWYLMIRSLVRFQVSENDYERYSELSHFFWSYLPHLNTWSALKSFRWGNPQTMMEQFSESMENPLNGNLECLGGTGVVVLHSILFFIRRIFFFVMGVFALRCKVMLLVGEFISYGNNYTWSTLYLIQFVYQLLNIDIVSSHMWNRLNRFVFTGEKGTWTRKDVICCRIYLAHIMQEIWNVEWEGWDDRILVMQSFSDDDMQMLLINETEKANWIMFEKKGFPEPPLSNAKGMKFLTMVTDS